MGRRRPAPTAWLARRQLRNTTPLTCPSVGWDALPLASPGAHLPLSLGAPFAFPRAA